MQRFELVISPESIVAKLSKGAVENERLLSALIDPLNVFLCEVTAQPALTVTVGIIKDEPQQVVLAVDKFLFRGTDLGRVPALNFIDGIVRARAGETMADVLGAPIARYVLGGIDFLQDGDGTPFGFSIETIHENLRKPLIPQHPYLVQTWLLYARLVLEQHLGAALPAARARAGAGNVVNSAQVEVPCPRTMTSRSNSGTCATCRRAPRRRSCRA